MSIGASSLPRAGASAKPAVICAGRLYCDLVFTGLPAMPRLGTETFAEGLSLHAGGGAFNTAACFAALGHEAALMATLPAAPFDRLVSEQIAACHVSSAFVTPAGDGAPQITVAVAQGDDRAFLSHKSGAAMVVPDHVAPPWRHLHVGELRSLVEHPDLLTCARAGGLTVSLDCGWDDALVDDGARLSDLIAKVDVFLPNAAEFARLKRSGLPDAAAPVVVVKNGAQGARLMRGGCWIGERAADPAIVVDATGAGDAFNGGFLSAWLAGASPDACLAEGNRCGAAAVSAPGGTGGLRGLAPVGA